MNRFQTLARWTRIAAWGYLFLYLNLKINNWNLLPEWVGWVLLYFAVRGLKEEQPKLSLLEKFAAALGLWALLAWIPALELPAWTAPASLAFSLMGMYFHFQFLTELSQIARRYEDSFTRPGLAGGLLTARTWVVVIQTAVIVIGFLLPANLEMAGFLALPMLLVGVVFCIYIVVLLFRLSGQLRAMTLEDP